MAKARFRELVRRARFKGPQHVSVHGCEEVVVIAVDEYRRLKGERSGSALIEALKASPRHEIDLPFEIEPALAPVGDKPLQYRKRKTSASESRMMSTITRYRRWSAPPKPLNRMHCAAQRIRFQGFCLQSTAPFLCCLPL